MNRLAATILFLGGAVLLATWLVPPAGSSPAARVTGAEDGAQDPIAPALAAVNAQVERLRVRVSVPAQFPPPRRDPFNFGVRSVTPAPAASIVPASETPPMPLLPKLVAILSDSADGGVVQTAVLSDGQSVEFVKLGDGMGSLGVAEGLRVTSITTDAVVLLDPASNRTFGLSLN
jgi:hypothetical protein